MHLHIKILKSPEFFDRESLEKVCRTKLIGIRYTVDAS